MLADLSICHLNWYLMWKIAGYNIIKEVIDLTKHKNDGYKSHKDLESTKFRHGS